MMKRAVAIVGVAIIVVYLLGWPHGSPKPVFSAGANAIWLAHAWVGESHTEDEYASLRKMLARSRISEAYFHAGPLLADGGIDPDRLRHAADLIAAFKASPGILLYAWLGQVEAKGGGPLDLSKALVRRKILRTAERLLALGFAGIHYDLEPIYSGDRDFLSLLAATHQLTRSRHARLSVAACRPEPCAGIEWVARWFARFPGYWRRPYYLEVAGLVDEVAVMTYDAAIPLPNLYSSLISSTVTWSIHHGVRELRIGIPTYDEVTIGHLPYVENVGNALRGLKEGTARLNKGERDRVGTAIYAEWTTSPREWRIYRQDWLNAAE